METGGNGKELCKWRKEGLVSVLKEADGAEGKVFSSLCSCSGSCP